MYSTKAGGINRDALKINAVITMLVDHIGAVLFKDITVLRIIGRLSFPIFAFMVAEGCSYTKNKAKYLFNLVLFGCIAQVMKVYFNQGGKLNIMFTFALSAVMVFALDKAVKVIKNDSSPQKQIYLSVLFILTVSVVWLVCTIFTVDYGFWGCMTPLITSAAFYIESDYFDRNKLKTILLAFALSLVYMKYGGVQIYAFAALIPLWFYNGQKGGNVPKYFFYIFYPVHLAVLYAIDIFI